MINKVECGTGYHIFICEEHLTTYQQTQKEQGISCQVIDRQLSINRNVYPARTCHYCDLVTLGNNIYKGLIGV